MMDAAKAPQIWIPKGTKPLSSHGTGHSIGLVGESGVGKSWLGRQMQMDDEFRDKILFITAENTNNTLEDLSVKYVREVRSINEAKEVLRECAAAERAGKLEFSVIFVDSVSGINDFQTEAYDSGGATIYAESGGRNKLAEFGDRGAGNISLMKIGRDEIRMADVVFVCTTAGENLCVPGKMTPDNFRRMTSVCLSLRPEKRRFPNYDPDNPPRIIEAGEIPEKGESTIQRFPHRSIEVDENGRVSGYFLDRVFTTMHMGEVGAKSHRNLAMRERAYLPDLIRKLHGRKAKYT